MVVGATVAKSRSSDVCGRDEAAQSQPSAQRTADDGLSASRPQDPGLLHLSALQRQHLDQVGTREHAGFKEAAGAADGSATEEGGTNGNLGFEEAWFRIQTRRQGSSASAAPAGPEVANGDTFLLLNGSAEAGEGEWGSSVLQTMIAADLQWSGMLSVDSVQYLCAQGQASCCRAKWKRPVCRLH